MFERQTNEPKTPPCPLCASQMTLKEVHRQRPADHFIFKCAGCAIEFPVVAKMHGR